MMTMYLMICYLFYSFGSSKSQIANFVPLLFGFFCVFFFLRLRSSRFISHIWVRRKERERHRVYMLFFWAKPKNLSQHSGCMQINRHDFNDDVSTRKKYVCWFIRLWNLLCIQRTTTITKLFVMALKSFAVQLRTQGLACCEINENRQSWCAFSSIYWLHHMNFFLLSFFLSFFLCRFK